MNFEKTSFSMINFFIFVAVAAGQLHNLYAAKATVFRRDTPLRFLAKIKMRGSTICSGVMYRENTVITTATHLQQAKKLYKVNVPNVTDTLRYLSYNVLDIHLHGNFSFSFKAKNNIAIVILKRTESMLTGMRLDTQFGYKIGSPAYMVGWGEVSERNAFREASLEIHLPIFDPIECSNIHRGSVNPKLELCAGYSIGNHDANFFLDASPIFFSYKGHHYLMGLFSWTDTYDFEYHPIVYTRISNFIPWINVHTETTINPGAD